FSHSRFVMAGLDPAIRDAAAGDGGRCALLSGGGIADGRVKPGDDEGRDERSCATSCGAAASQDGSRLSPGQRDRGWRILKLIRASSCSLALPWRKAPHARAAERGRLQPY